MAFLGFSDVLSVLAMAAVALSSGLIGAFALMRKMTLASDAISHVALPGLGLAILLKINPLLGGAAALVGGAVLIWIIERKTRIATETVIGVVFSASLAVGALLTPEEELLETLFGDVRAIGFTEALAGIAIALAITAFVFLLKERITLSVISPDLGKTMGLDVDRLNLVFLLLFALNVILGLHFLGVLLMGSLIIVPAATAKNIAWNLSSDLWLSAAISLVSVLIGLSVSLVWGFSVGPTIISAAAALFFVSLLFKRS